MLVFQLNCDGIHKSTCGTCKFARKRRKRMMLPRCHWCRVLIHITTREIVAHRDPQSQSNISREKYHDYKITIFWGATLQKFMIPSNSAKSTWHITTTRIITRESLSVRMHFY